MREQELIVYKDFEKEEGTLLFDMAWLMEHYEDDYYNREDLAGLLYDCMQPWISRESLALLFK